MDIFVGVILLIVALSNMKTIKDWALILLFVVSFMMFIRGLLGIDIIDMILDTLLMGDGYILC